MNMSRNLLPVAVMLPFSLGVSTLVGLSFAQAQTIELLAGASDKVYSSSVLDGVSDSTIAVNLEQKTGLAIAAEAAPEAGMPVVKPPPEVASFLDRVLHNLPKPSHSGYAFTSWEQPGKATEEGVGMMPLYGATQEDVVKRIMDVDHYKGNIDHVIENRSVKDPRFTPPQAVRFYQHLDLSLLGDIHHELVLVDGGARQGYRVVYWYMLDKETQALSRKKGMRSDYNVGAWIISKDSIGYALSSAPKKEDTNFLQWQSLTSGADVAAKGVVEANIKGMVAWAKR